MGVGVCVILVIFIPPLMAPLGASFWLLFSAYLCFAFMVATLCSVVVGLVKKRWEVLPALALVILLFLPIRILDGHAEGIWQTKFEESQAIRQRFLTFMDLQPTSENRVKLPDDLKGLSDGKYAYLTTDEAGSRFYCYSVFTHGIDNSRGYCWSQSGKPPSELAFPQIVRSKALGGGWFVFFST